MEEKVDHSSGGIYGFSWEPSGPGHNDDTVVELEAQKDLNIANVANLTCTTVYLKDKTDWVMKTWTETNAKCVVEI